jgi:hypothetical protein
MLPGIGPGGPCPARGCTVGYLRCYSTSSLFEGSCIPAVWVYIRNLYEYGFPRSWSESPVITSGTPYIMRLCMDGFHDISQFLANAPMQDIRLWQIAGAESVDCGICFGQVESVRHLLAHRADSHTQGRKEANSVSLGIAKRTPRSCYSAPSRPLRRCE